MAEYREPAGGDPSDLSSSRAARSRRRCGRCSGDISSPHLGLGAAFAAWAIARLRPVAAAAPLDGPPPEIDRSRPAPSAADPRLAGLLEDALVRFAADQVALESHGRCDSSTSSALSRTRLASALLAYNGGRSGVAEVANIYIRMVGTMVLCGMLLFIAGLAASSIGRERQKQTLDELLLDRSLDG